MVSHPAVSQTNFCILMPYNSGGGVPSPSYVNTLSMNVVVYMIVVHPLHLRSNPLGIHQTVFPSEVLLEGTLFFYFILRQNKANIKLTALLILNKQAIV